MSAITDLQATVQTSFAALSSREKRMVGGAGLAVAVFVVFMVIFSFGEQGRRDPPPHRRARSLKLDEVQTLATGYRDAKARQDALEGQLRASNVRLVSYLEEKAKPAGIELPSINPKADVPLEGSKIVESAVEVTLTDVKLNRLVDFLQAVEAGPGIVKVKYLRLEPAARAGDRHRVADRRHLQAEVSEPWPRRRPASGSASSGTRPSRLFALFATFFLTFPYDALKDRVRLEADNAGLLRAHRPHGPGLLRGARQRRAGEQEVEHRAARPKRCRSTR